MREMLTHISLQLAVEATAANLPRWAGGATVKKDAPRIIPAWSRFYLKCRICHEPVLDDKVVMQAHWDHHIITGDIALKEG